MQIMLPQRERAAVVLGSSMLSALSALLVSFLCGVVLTNLFVRSRAPAETAALNGAIRPRTGIQQSLRGNANNYCLLQLQGVRDIRLFSQNDEDGALLQLLRCMGGHGTKEYFEFGSEDGSEVNTRVLRELYDWHGHLLDGGYERPTIPLHKEFFTPSNIAALMQKYNVSKNLDVLSVDADYDDFWILREILVAGYKPRILITEYNCNLGDGWSVSAFPKPVGKEASSGWTYDCYFGASASAFIALAGAFGYAPVWANTVNLMFVRLDHATELGMVIPSVESFPGPYMRALHHPCNKKTWRLIDDSYISKAADKKTSHIDFANGFGQVTLEMRTYETSANGMASGEVKTGLTWRIFKKAR